MSRSDSYAADQVHDDADGGDDLIALNGLLDGELPPARASSLRQRIASDPALRARWLQLQAEDGRWRTMARAAQSPMTLPSSATASRGAVIPSTWLALLVLALMAGRVLTKMLPLDLATAILLHGLLLALALAMVTVAARRMGILPG